MVPAAGPRRDLQRRPDWSANQTVGQESAASIRLNRVIAQPGPLTGKLRAAGVRYVVVDAGPAARRARATDLAAAARLPGARLVMASRDLVVFLLPEETP